MKNIKIENISGNESYINQELCGKLNNKIFHITPEKNFEDILNSGEIKHFRDLNLNNHNWSDSTTINRLISDGNQSFGIYRYKNKRISVYDFHHSSSTNWLEEDGFKNFSFKKCARGKIAYVFVLKIDSYAANIETFDQIKEYDPNDIKMVTEIESARESPITAGEIEKIIKIEFLD